MLYPTPCNARLGVADFGQSAIVCVCVCVKLLEQWNVFKIIHRYIVAGAYYPLLYFGNVCVVCVCLSVRLPGPETIALIILILFGCGRYSPKEYGKNTRKLKLCIIMHTYAKYAFFESWLKTTFLCISDDFKHFLFFSPKIFFEMYIPLTNHTKGYSLMYKQMISLLFHM